MKKITYPSFYRSLYCFLLLTLAVLPVLSQTKIRVDNSMISNDKNNAQISTNPVTFLIDHQGTCNPVGGTPGSSATQWIPSYNEADYPAKTAAILDLRQALPLSHICFYYTNGRTDSAMEVKVYAGSPGNWTQVNLTPAHTMAGWQITALSLSARYLRIVLNKSNRIPHEMVLYTSSSNEVPVSNAGTPQTVNLPVASVNLTGSGSDDGSIVSYQWTKQSGPPLTLTNSNQPTVKLSYLQSGIYTLGLTVTDNSGLIGYSETQVTVNAPAPTPSAKIPSALFVATREPNTGNPNSTGNPSKMFDQQNETNPAGGNNRWNEGFTNSTNYPVSAYVDLGQDYHLTNVRIFDGSGAHNLIIEYGSPGNWHTWVTDPLSGYMVWHDNPVNKSTRFVRFTQTGDAEFNEVIFEGYPNLMCNASGTSRVMLTNFVNSYQDAAGNLIRTALATEGYSTASSINKLAPNTDGYVEWTVAATDATSQYCVALSQNVNDKYISLACKNGVFRACAYGVFDNYPFYRADANGNLTTAKIEFTPGVGDKVQIKRAGNDIVYSRLNSLGAIMESVTLPSVYTQIYPGTYSFTLRERQLQVVLSSAQGIVPVLTASFCEYLSAIRLNDDLTCGTIASTANLTISPQGGKQPLSYTWSYKTNLDAAWTTETATTAQRTDLPYGNTYKVVISENGTATKTYSYGIGSKLNWIDQFNTRFNKDGSLERVEPEDYSKIAFAHSQNMIEEGKDGWIEWRVGDFNSSSYVIALDYSMNTDSHPYYGMGMSPFGDNLLSFGSMTYGGYRSPFESYVGTDGKLMATVNGVTSDVRNNNILLSVLPDDVLRIARVGNKIRYYKNGEPIQITLNLVSHGTVTRTMEFEVITTLRMMATAMIGRGKIPPITASFCVPLQALIVNRPAESIMVGSQPTDVFGKTMTVEATGGVAPYSYKWLHDNSTTERKTNLSYSSNNGTYKVEMTDATGKTIVRQYGVGFQTQWAQASNAITWQDGSVSRQGEVTGRVKSANIITGDGWVEFTVGKTTQYQGYQVGLSFADAPLGSPISFGAYIGGSSHFMWLQKDEGEITGCTGEISGWVCMYSIHGEDVVRIAREGNQIKYYVSRILPGQTSMVVRSFTLTPAQTNAPLVVSALVSVVSEGKMPMLLCSHPNTNPDIVPAALGSPSDADKNYVVENTILIPVTDPTVIPTLSVQDMSQKIGYFDGLGRPIESVISMASPNKKDIVAVNVYDDFGREIKKYLPYTSSPVLPSGSKFHSFDFSNTTAYQNSEQYRFYHGQTNIAVDNAPFAETLFETSPLNRVLEQGAVGSEWQIIDRNNAVNNTSNNYTVKMLQRTNTAGEIRLWTYNADETASSTMSYNAGELMVMQTTDEHGLLIREYEDKEGKVICKKVQKVKGNESSFISTYYVYDDFGNLRFVLPPEAINTLNTSGNFNIDYTSTFTAQWLFTYKYDYRQRMIEKQVPGGEKTVMVYNKVDKLIMSQNKNQRTRNEWSFTKYDALSRPVLTGLYIHPSDISQAEMQCEVTKFYLTNPAAFSCGSDIGRNTINTTALDPTKPLFEEKSNTNFSVNQGYTIRTFPNGSVAGSTIRILSVNYYDDFDLNLSGTIETNEPTYLNPTPERTGLRFETSSFRTRGKLTATKVLVLDGQTTPRFLLTANFYDQKSRVIQTQGENYVNGIDLTSMRYDFAGRVLESKLQHGISGNPMRVVMFTRNSYDHSVRLSKSEFAIDPKNAQNQPTNDVSLTDWKTLATYTYNELGQLIDKKLGQDANKAVLQEVDFAYNIRGWLRKINDATLSESGDVFGMELMYSRLDAVSGEMASPNYNGNISKISWKSKTDEVFRSYEYKYDGLNRLLEGRYTSSKSGENFTLTGMSYDDNGNILSLKRNNLINLGLGNQNNPVFGLVDDLMYNYTGTGNRLKAVSDVSEYKNAGDALSADFSKIINYTGAAEYDYDVAGSLQRDENKGITSIVYDHLNLPEQIVFESGDKITNVYDANGIKLEKRVLQGVSSPTSTYYVAGMVYEGTSITSNTLQFIPISEGRLLPRSTGGYAEEYFIKDHLGNLRVSFREGVKTIYTATMETSNASTEDIQWMNIASTRTAYSCPTVGQSGAKLTSTNRFGPWRELKIGKGDELRFSAKAFYQSNAAAFSTVDLLNLIQVGSAAITLIGNQNNNVEKLRVSLGFVPRINIQSNQLKAYLQYIVYDKNYNFVTSGRRMVTTDALNNCNSILELGYKATADGYVQVMVVNEGDRDVFFDDIILEQKTALITQESSYDPFGLVLSGIDKLGNPENKFKYNSKELISDLDLNWNDYGARSYDPALNRWCTIDPDAFFYDDSSPYVYVLNNPIINRDINGRNVYLVIDGNLILAKKDDNDHTFYSYNDDVLTKLNQFGKDANIVMSAISKDDPKFESLGQGLSGSYEGSKGNELSRYKESVGIYNSSNIKNSFNDLVIFSLSGFGLLEMGYAQFTAIARAKEQQKALKEQQKALREKSERNAKIKKAQKEINLREKIERSGMKMDEAGEFFGWETSFNTKSFEDFSKELLLSKGWTKEIIKEVADAYKAVAETAKGNPSAAVRAKSMQEMLEHFK